MKKLFYVFFVIYASIQFSYAATIIEETATAKTRADACLAATKKAEAGKYGFLESQGRIQEVKKDCTCDRDSNGQWSCLATIAYVEKK